MKEKIERMYEKIGFDPNLSGTGYFVAATQMVMEDRRVQLTNEIYPALAAAAGCSWKNVERNMRYALEVAQDSWRFDPHWQDLAGGRAPTNGRVLRCMARWARSAD